MSEEDDLAKRLHMRPEDLKCPICGRPTALHICVLCMYKVVGWHVDGKQYCRDCYDKHIRNDGIEHFEKFPIKKGDTDWGWGSVPFCVICHEELPTIVEEEE